MALTRPLRSSTRLRRTVQLGAAAAACAVALSACGSGTKVSSSKDAHYVTSSSGIVTAAKTGRQDAPDLSGTTVDGKKLDVGAADKGKIVVVNVWGSWCPPCRDETAHLVKVAKQLKAKGVEFVGINTRDTTGNAKAFETGHDMPYPSLFDPSGKLILRFPKGSLSPQSIPSTVVIDREGKIAARKSGGVDEETLHKMIDPLLAEK
ncbi:TlpA disulfide reductase family protein [Streptomyces sp. NPDC051322]|uniref:TlpA family protein disulfide reductase n=1 Tax=Streptomyces sp. NPDC051322 TaxID=3154645 RepID=UPI00345091B8